MKEWIYDKLGYLIFPAAVIGFIFIAWLVVTFDLGESVYDENGNPNIEVHQQYGGR